MAEDKKKDICCMCKEKPADGYSKLGSFPFCSACWDNLGNEHKEGANG